MRIAKLLLTLSLSVLLLAVSWSLLTGQLGLPRPAHAQVGDPFVSIAFDGNSVFALTEAGHFWSYGGVIPSISYKGQFGGGAVPTTDQSASGLKSRYGGDN